ncbi:hypothetical protein SAY86_019717 [Trapa natans]|uniref:non-specific serine/threonine protein kinase n=1 Tax=Trapa natans TaxID=22666 RepID=A0AAN7LHT5_TRANT|nr:hypothetical protein SAY86_019717 [Trapa natans]
MAPLSSPHPCRHLLPATTSILYLILIAGVPLSSVSGGLFSDCSSSFSCGNVTDLSFPFWGGDRPNGCGYPQLKLTCEVNSTFISIAGLKYSVLGFDNQTQVLRIARQDFLLNGICLTKFINTTLDSQLFDLVIPKYFNFRFVYGCPPAPTYLHPPHQFNCSSNTMNPYGYIWLVDQNVPLSCNTSVVVPLRGDPALYDDSAADHLSSILQEGFEVKLKVDSGTCSQCVGSNGVCGYDPTVNATTCFCPGQSSGSKSCSITSTTPPPAPPASSQQGKKGKASLGTGIAIAGVGMAGILLGMLLFFILRKRMVKRSSLSTGMKDLPPTPSRKSLLAHANGFTRRTPSYPTSNSSLENGSTYFGVRVFSYQELEEATDNFHPSRELGDGGFGTVYYGKLGNGRPVAIKRLYEHNLKRAEQFMNELVIMTRLQHPGLVKLHGCTSRRSQELLLVFEYVPNGTVADHLFRGRGATSAPLPWRTRLDIAIEAADALAYLHASDVIHRDLKTANILLDKGFHVKVADFGLSRLFPSDVSHISTAPQGTPGYVDPDYYQCYTLTDKSDVYSFGVVLCELISSKPAVDTNRHRHDINLASMAVNKIQNREIHELVDPDLGFGTYYTVRKEMTLVAELAFRCLQQDRNVRPAMAEVVDTLRAIGSWRGSIDKAVVHDGLAGFVEKKISRTRKAEVMEIRSDDVGLLRNNVPPPTSDDSAEWASDFRM